MDMPVLTHRITLAEFLQMPETKLPMELVDGLVVMNPPPNVDHQRVIGRLLLTLHHQLPSGFEVLPSPLGWLLSDDPHPEFREPDLVIVPTPEATGPMLTEPPLLAVEVLSPSGVSRDLVEKRRLYGEAGLRHYWVVNPDPAEIIVFGWDATRSELTERQRAIGDQRLALREPFTLEVVPADL